MLSIVPSSARCCSQVMGLLLVGILTSTGCQSLQSDAFSTTHSKERGLGKGEQQKASHAIAVFFKKASRRSPGHLEAAVWSDGDAVWCRSQPDNRIACWKLKLSQEEITKLKRRLKDIGMEKFGGLGWNPPDASTYWFAINLDAKPSMLMWDQVIAVGYGNNHNATQKYLDFVAAWYQSKIVLIDAIGHGQQVESRMLTPEDALMGFDHKQLNKPDWVSAKP